MATTKPRITVTLTPRQHEVLKVISDCGGQPMSTFISEMLELSLPTLERMASAFQKIKAAQDIQRKKIVAELDEAQAAIEPIVQATVGQFDLFMAKVEQAAGVAAATDGVRGAAGGADTPEAAPAPATNRGATGRKGMAGKAGQKAVSSDSVHEKNSRKRSMPAS